MLQFCFQFIDPILVVGIGPEYFLAQFLAGAGLTTGFFFPVLTSEWSTSVAEGRINSMPLLGSLCWLVLLLGSAGAVFSHRDLR